MEILEVKSSVSQIKDSRKASQWSRPGRRKSNRDWRQGWGVTTSDSHHDHNTQELWDTIKKPDL
jgi:hypothetical protein